MISIFLVCFALLCFYTAWNIVARPEYRSGTIWCFMRWTEVDSEYITRLHVVKTPWFAVCLHWINHPDPEPYNHDHPVTFLSLILRGWYTEERETPERGLHVVRHKWWNFIRASPEDRHTIIRCAPNTLTLCFMGPKTREWGFHIDDESVPVWMHWKEYYRRQREEIAAERATVR